ncbi:tyrosine-type recombinase/integrase [Vibrio parahaemolyticus]|nr:tyrosine-type recombinase/integrase [Vibrio parahaemolyticus]EHZ2740728.1 tyrosine-type recombinase/integrase [Vibrio parahaemolyticus]EJL6720075.1 tyrosine-type recombinase/integrase [Vibrio alginolyticus]
MARTTKPLTDKEIKSAKPKDKEYTLTDGQGLQLRIMPQGTRSWRLVYKSPATQKQAKMTLGTYPSLTLASARERTRFDRELIAQGIDPKEYYKKQQITEQSEKQNTLFKISSEWLARKENEVSPDYLNDLRRSLELHVFEELGDVPVTFLRAPQVINVLKVVEAKGSLETVKRLTQRINEIMTYAVNCGYVETNPLSGIGDAFKKHKKANMPAISPAELPELMKELEYASIKLTTRCLIEFQLHTMTRPREASEAKWSEIDREEKVWTIPAERMKKRKQHHIPLTQQSLDLLVRMEAISGHREYIFPSDRDPSRPTNSQTANAALKRMGYQRRLVAHGLRSIASTALNEHGFDYDLVEAALAHGIKDSSRAAYLRSDFFKRRRPMMDWWSSFIENS